MSVSSTSRFLSNHPITVQTKLDRDVNENSIDILAKLMQNPAELKKTYDLAKQNQDMRMIEICKKAMNFSQPL